MKSQNLTRRRGRFVSEYVETEHARQAARVAGYPARIAYSQESRLLTSVEVQQLTENTKVGSKARIPDHPVALVRFEQNSSLGETLETTQICVNDII
ncbi:MAG: terminase small subunit [Dehalococcoidia bacterium]|jgi:phage terminase small subunit|nr:terminase small subunit [Dehalococcoidia bacterium]